MEAHKNRKNNERPTFPDFLFELVSVFYLIVTQRAKLHLQSKEARGKLQILLQQLMRYFSSLSSLIFFLSIC